MGVREAPGLVELGHSLPGALAESQTKCPEAGAIISRESAMERAIVACFYGSGVDGAFLDAFLTVLAPSTFQVPVWARVLWWVLCLKRGDFSASGLPGTCPH